MNSILASIAATLAVVAFTTVIFAADVPAPAPSAPAAVIGKPSITDTNMKHLQVDNKARAAKAAASKSAESVTPADKAATSARASKLRKAQQLKKRSKAARKNAQTMGSGIPAEKSPVVSPAAK